MNSLAPLGFLLIVAAGTANAANTTATASASICSTPLKDLIWYDQKTNNQMPCALYNGQPAEICTWACRCRKTEGSKAVCTAFDSDVPCAAQNTECPVNAIKASSSASSASADSKPVSSTSSASADSKPVSSTSSASADSKPVAASNSNSRDSAPSPAKVSKTTTEASADSTTAPAASKTSVAPKSNQQSTPKPSTQSRSSCVSHSASVLLALVPIWVWTNIC